MHRFVLIHQRFIRCAFFNCVVIFHVMEISEQFQISHPQTDTKTRKARCHKWIEVLTQAANNKQNIQFLSFQVVPEEINKANKTICFSLRNPHDQPAKWSTKDEMAAPKNLR